VVNLRMSTDKFADFLSSLYDSKRYEAELRGTAGCGPEAQEP
jgi:hypothetical protein